MLGGAKAGVHQCGGCGPKAAVDNGRGPVYFASLIAGTFLVAYVVFRVLELAGALISWAVLLAPCVFVSVAVFRVLERFLLVRRRAGNVERGRGERLGVVHERRNRHEQHEAHLPLGVGMPARSAGAPFAIDDGPIEGFDVIDVESWEEEPV